MDYAEAQAAFFTPRAGDVVDLDWSTPARRLRDAIEPLATICFWSEPAYDAYAARGLDFLQGYVWGRSCALGEPEPTVAAAAFGVFEPGLVASLYAAGRGVCPLADIRAAKVEGVTAALTAVHGAATAEVAAVAAQLRAAASTVPAVGRPFFAGWTAVPWPDEPWAQLWQACSMLRELRGDGHLAAVVAAGLDGVEANVLTELWVGFEPLAYTGSRAWSPEAMAAATATLTARGLVADGVLTAAGRTLREQIETVTDAAVAPAIVALDNDGSTGAQDVGGQGNGLDAVVERLLAWATPVVERGWFPPDPYKRAAG